MDYREASLRKYLDDAASDLPAPGGGSVAALAGALGSAMGCMVANFTVGKKKYAAVEQRVKELLQKCDSARKELLNLAQRDVEAYQGVSEAYKIPKEQKETRARAIQEALKKAMNVPLETLRICHDLMDVYRELGEKGNRNLISDVGVAAIMTEAALQAAKLNVEINLAYLKDEQLVARVRNEIEEKALAASEAARQIVASVVEAIRG